MPFNSLISTSVAKITRHNRFTMQSYLASESHHFCTVKVGWKFRGSLCKQLQNVLIKSGLKSREWPVIVWAIQLKFDYHCFDLFLPTLICWKWQGWAIGLLGKKKFWWLTCKLGSKVSRLKMPTSTNLSYFYHKTVPNRNVDIITKNICRPL